MDTETTASELTPKRPSRRRLKRVLIGVAVLLITVFLLVLAGPAILTSGPAERKLSSELSQRLGLSVRVENVAFGWRTSLRIGRVSVGEDTGRINSVPKHGVSRANGSDDDWIDAKDDLRSSTGGEKPIPVAVVV